MRKLTAAALIALVLPVALAGCGVATSVEEEKSAIATLVHTRYGAEPLSVDPIVVRGDYGIAGWTLDDKGGRTLVHKEKGQWRTVVTAGAEARDVGFLMQAGMPESEAKALANVLITTERKIPETRLALFDRSDVQR